MCTLAAKRYAAATTMPSSSSEPSSHATTSQRTKRRRLDDGGIGSASRPIVPRTAHQRQDEAPSPDALPSRAARVTPPPQKRRRVGFSPSARVTEVPRWTSEEHRASWYTAQDIACFKLQEGIDAHALRCMLGSASSLAQLPKDTSIYRGLERLLSPQISAEIVDRRRAAAKGVLLEQGLQRATGLRDEARIAAASRGASRGAEAWARTLGGLP